MVDASIPLAHIVAQTRQNITFLVSQNQITATDAQEILAKLPPAHIQDPILTSPHLSRTNSLSQKPTSAQPSVKARALWGYNEGGQVRCVVIQNSRLSISFLQEVQDLSFRAGDVIEIISEMNPDWWTGRINGRDGLFPSNHVEKIAKQSTPPTSPTQPPPLISALSSPIENKIIEPNPPTYQPPSYASGGFISHPPPHLFRNVTYAGSAVSQTWFGGPPPHASSYVGSSPIVHNPNAGPPHHRPDQPAFLRPGFA
jgi:hypothetical protein